ncbi:tetratricopeptide repeat protein [Clostridium paridis]|uniref:Sel1 repeat family protein n=1 Tax=Clostridium paridis TaxID=2803863 RepID=A0A937K287_9CLOT|nr:tetratricopeptide repeat protein [Clostridium paridis]MBL4930432.1 sel1 repeat family protein [Clostridium paridis]
MADVIEFKRRIDLENDEEAIEKEDAETQYFIAKMYLNGDGIEVNVEKGIKWLEKSAENGDMDAQSELGMYYYNGNMVERDFDKAVRLFKMSTENGNPIACICLGTAYMHGKGVESKDYNKAYECFKKVHDMGETIGTYYLGDCYFKGIGVEKDLLMALDFYGKALGDGYKYDMKNIELCLKESIDLYQSVEEQVKNGDGIQFGKLVELRKKISSFSDFIELFK